MHRFVFLFIFLFALTSSGFATPSFDAYNPALLHSTPFAEPESSTEMSASMQQRLVSFVNNTIDTLHYSAYKFGGSRFDSSKGIYIVDCSNYVDRILHAVSPSAYLHFENSMRTDSPSSSHYFQFFSKLRHDPYWSKVKNVKELQAGDVLVFKGNSAISTNRRHARRHRRSSPTREGHVMVVMDTPVNQNGAYLVRVTDSAPVGHSEDTRAVHVSGIGIGTMLLKVNPKTGQPLAYAWRTSSDWKRNVAFAMARPLDVT